MKELVRCRPCGFVIEADKLGDVCPACGMPRKVFEPYREKVSLTRLKVLNLDLHPIAIHLSQALVVGIPLIIIMINLFAGFYPEVLKNVLLFSVFIFPFTLLIAIVTGLIDGLTRFKTINTPLLRIKIIFSLLILVLSITLLVISRSGNSFVVTIILSLLCLATGIRLGLWGKKLINVILPGSFPKRRGSRKPQPVTGTEKNAEAGPAI